MSHRSTKFIVRRLSTPSSAFCKHEFATHWNWIDNHNKWLVPGSGLTSTVCELYFQYNSCYYTYITIDLYFQRDIEQVYQTHTSGFFKCVLNGRRCIIDFPQMTLYDANKKTICGIQRRPQMNFLIKDMPFHATG